MRITIVGINYSPEVTGIAPYTTGIAEGLTSRGHDVAVITGLPHYPEWRIAEQYRDVRRQSSRSNGVMLHRVRHYVPETSSAFGRVRMETSFGLGAVTKRWKRPDVVIAVSPALLSAAAVVARARIQRIPVGVIVQDVYSKGVVETGALDGRSARLTAQLESAVLRSADGVAVIHSRLGEALLDIGVTPERTAVIRNWTHIKGDVSAQSDVSARQSFGWRPDEIVVLHTGNMGAKQGLENVIAAAKLATESGRADQPVRFVLVGDGNQRRALVSQAVGIGSVDMIEPLPAAKFRAALDAADVLLINERPGVGSMAVPSKLTSYFIAGKPILAATDAGSGSACEIIASGAGCVVPPGDPKALLTAVREMVANADAMRRYGEHGRAYAQDVLSADNAVVAYESWCEKLAGRS